MAIVRELEHLTLERDSAHTEVKCTYSIIEDSEGEKFLQIDTYGSSSRQIPGKKSQSIRFSPDAIAQLRKIIAQEF